MKPDDVFGYCDGEEFVVSGPALPKGPKIGVKEFADKWEPINGPARDMPYKFAYDLLAAQSSPAPEPLDESTGLRGAGGDAEEKG